MVQGSEEQDQDEKKEENNVLLLLDSGIFRRESEKKLLPPTARVLLNSLTLSPLMTSNLLTICGKRKVRFIVKLLKQRYRVHVSTGTGGVVL